MHALDGKGLGRRLADRRAGARCGPLSAALLTLLLLCCLWAAVAPAGATAAPGRPTAKSPTGTVLTTKPTFKWSRAARATRYEVRAYKGATLLVKKTGIAGLSWTSGKALPRGVDLTWKVRGRKAGVNGPWSRSLKFKVAGSARAITAFSFQGLSPPVVGSIDQAAHTVALTMRYGTDVSALVATFTTSGASVAVGATPQVSGLTANDFSSPVTYTVTAASGVTQAYVVTVTVAPLAVGDDYQGGIVAYILQPGDPGYVAGQTRGLIAADADQTTDAGMPWRNGSYIVTGATQTALGSGSAATTTIITVQGAVAGSYAAGLARVYSHDGYADWYLPSKDELDKLWVNRVEIGGFAPAYYWSSSEINDTDAWSEAFNNGAQYVGGKAASFRVRAVRAFPADPAKAITAFSFEGLAPAVAGGIDETAHTIDVIVPEGTDLSALVATFGTTGAVVAVGATPQASGMTANDFGSPVTYTVTAADASTQDYAVTVTAANPVSLWYIGNGYGVDNGGTPPTVTLASAYKVTDAWTYHWNYGQGAPAGTISLKAADDTVYGPWPTTLVSGVYWKAVPMQVIPAGTYTVIDSDPSTWAQNSATGGWGMSWANGIPSP